MFGFSSNNPTVISSDFDKAFNIFSNLDNRKSSQVSKFIANELQEVFESSNSADWKFNYYENLKNDNDRNLKNWKSLGIYENKLSEIVAIDLLFLYSKAIKYAKNDFKTFQSITIKINAIAEMAKDKSSISNDEKIIIQCSKCSQKLRVKNVTGWIDCPNCKHTWLREIN